MSITKLNIGKIGETLAVQNLTAKGYQIIHQNWRFSNRGEIDIIALESETGTLVFAEVKTRRGVESGHPLEAISVTKQRQIIFLAEQFMSSQDFALLSNINNIRFDAIGVLIPINGNPPEIFHIPNAFDAS